MALRELARVALEIGIDAYGEQIEAWLRDEIASESEALPRATLLAGLRLVQKARADPHAFASNAERYYDELARIYTEWQRRGQT